MRFVILGISFIFALSTWARCPSLAPCLEFSEENEAKFTRTYSSEREEIEETDIDFSNKEQAPYDEFLGIPYLYGGEDKTGIDCSSFSQKLFKKIGINLGRNSRDQFNQKNLKEISVENLAPYDLLFFKENPREEISHVAVYLGDGKMIHSSRREGKVAISDFSNSTFWKRLFFKAKRISTEENL